MPSDPKLTDSQYRVAAMNLYANKSDDNIEVDDCSATGDTLVARCDDSGSDGAWVKAWLWVPNEDAEKVES